MIYTVLILLVANGCLLYLYLANRYSNEIKRNQLAFFIVSTLIGLSDKIHGFLHLPIPVANFQWRDSNEVTMELKSIWRKGELFYRGKIRINFPLADDSDSFAVGDTLDIFISRNSHRNRVFSHLIFTKPYLRCHNDSGCDYLPCRSFYFHNRQFGFGHFFQSISVTINFREDGTSFVKIRSSLQGSQ